MEAARKEKAIDALNMAASFKTVAEDWLTTRVSGWSESYTKQVRSALEKDVYPVLGKRSIVDITARVELIAFNLWNWPTDEVNDV